MQDRFQRGGADDSAGCDLHDRGCEYQVCVTRRQELDGRSVFGDVDIGGGRDGRITSFGDWVGRDGCRSFPGPAGGADLGAVVAPLCFERFRCGKKQN